MGKVISRLNKALYSVCFLLLKTNSKRIELTPEKKVTLRGEGEGRIVSVTLPEAPHTQILLSFITFTESNTVQLKLFIL